MSVATLARILRSEIVNGIYELAVHPGYFDPAVQLRLPPRPRAGARDALRPARPRDLRDEGIRLISYDDLPEAVAALGHA